MRPRLWIVTPELHRRGGTERCFAEEIDRWKSEFDITVYTMKVEGVSLDGVRVKMIPYVPGPHLFRYIYWLAANHIARSRDSRREGRPDVLFSPGINCLDADVIGVHIVFLKHWRFVRDQTIADLKRPDTFLRTLHRVAYWKLLHLLESKVYAGPATLWAISKWDAGYLERRFRRPIGSLPVIPHGVDGGELSPERSAALRGQTRESLGLRNRRAVFLFGNDFYKKGMDVAVRALTLLPEDVVLAVRGSFDTAPLWALARELGVAGRIVIAPSLTDVAANYGAADVVIAPSREDSFSMPPLEAMACGVPVVVSDRVGAAELFEHGEHALITTDPESPEELAKAVETVLNDEPTRARLIERGLELARRCTWDDAAERAAQVFRRRIAERRSRSR